MPPSPPVTPEAYDKTKDSVSLKWKLPRHDGKGRIFGYLVEHQKPGAVDWVQANETPEQCPDLHYVVTGLSDGQDYTFRIFTVNAAGKSDPAYVKQTIKVHDRLGEEARQQRIDLDSRNHSLAWFVCLFVENCMQETFRNES